ncbi:MAG: tetratricopeptide repeat protein [Holophagales bacterium]|nr:tetratricopeptide repeat protein [Holophagales bacterium]MYF96715.1 tetratricopeptide repeat protein [Holophagales bacterium]
MSGLLLGLLLAGATAAAAQEPPATEDARKVRALLSLDAVPEPTLNHLDPEQREQLAADRLAATDALADAATDEQAQHAANVFGDLCLQYLHHELHGAVAVCLAQLRLLAPNDFQWTYYELLLHDATGNLERARLAARAALALRPDDTATLIRAGDLHLDAGDLDAAATAYARALEVRPESAAARFGLGRVAMDRGETGQAIAAFEEVLTSQPEGSVVQHHLGMALRAGGDATRARAELGRNRQVPIAIVDPLRDRLQIYGLKTEARFDRAVRAARSGRNDEAIALYRELLVEDDGDPEVHFNLARSLIETGDHAGSEEHLRRAIDINPSHGAAHFNLALLLGRTGRTAEGALHLERAADIDPENLQWRLVRAQARADAGNASGARSELEAIVRLDPGAIEAHRLLAAMLLEAGEPARAADHLEALAALTPDDLRVHFNLGLTRFGTGEFAAAREALETALERFPGDLAVRHLLARLLATSPDAGVRDGERAVQLARSVVDEQPALDHLETLAMAMAETGRFEEAVSWQQRALDREREAGGGNSPQRLDRLRLYQAGQPLRAPGGGR